MDIYEQDITSRIAAGQTYRQISQALQQRISSSLGFSPRNLPRFWGNRHALSMWVDRSAVGPTSCISDPVSWTFIWKMYDALRALGIHVSQRRVSASMVRVVPRAQPASIHSSLLWRQGTFRSKWKDGMG